MGDAAKVRPGFLEGVRVLELADELGEYCGKLLGGLGAEVIKIEPPGGETTRTLGPFRANEAGTDSSLHFWHYNLGKKSVVLDLNGEEGQAAFRRLLTSATVVVESRPAGFLAERGLSHEEMQAVNPSLVVAHITPFGDTGPWADYQATDLVHLALGGVAANCGYDPKPDGFYDTSPVAPQMWQSYHCVGELTVHGIIAALLHRHVTGEGQVVSSSVHEAVAKTTEGDLPDWVYNGERHWRMTCRHSRSDIEPAEIVLTKDGRWIRPWVCSPFINPADLRRSVEVLERYGMADDLSDPKYQDADYLARYDVLEHIYAVFAKLSAKFRFDDDIWREFQAAGVGWSPLRRPEENIDDPHWRQRGSIVDIEHPELGVSFAEIGARWVCQKAPWSNLTRAPLLGEHTGSVLGGLDATLVSARAKHAPEDGAQVGSLPLAGVRFIDLTWLLASGGAGRFLAALGAEVIKVEHQSKPDFIRYPGEVHGKRHLVEDPDGKARYEMEPLEVDRDNPNRNGFFMDANAGKRAISLDLKHPRGRELLARLLRDANATAEGFTPGAMDRMGFGYDVLKEINPSIVYVQQSGMGKTGIYGDMRSTGPIAQAFSGLSEMSGMPAPYPPAGIGYSYLDWFGAYNVATALLAGLYRQRTTGEGCWIDCSQVDIGIYLTGSAVLDYSVNDHSWQRYGNGSPYCPAAPHGIYRTAGEDRWIALACRSESDWHALGKVLGEPSWMSQSEFSSLEQRLQHSDRLDLAVESATENFEGYELMERLQDAGVAAGVCQTAQDRYETDPQLQHLEWLTDLPQSEIGTWPVKEFPVKLSRTPGKVGGTIRRHGPNYGEDNTYVYGELLGLSGAEIGELEELGVI